MKILLSSLVYMPEQTGYRAHDLAVGLTELGHDVISMTGFPSYPFGKVYDGYKLQARQWEYLDGVKVLRIPYIMNRSKSAMQRVISYSSFSLLSILYGTFMMWKPDVIWTNQIGYPGLWLSKIKNAVHIHEVQDLWPEWSRTVDLEISNGVYSILDALQAGLYKKADRITTISKGFKGWLVDKGIRSEKISVIPNWADNKYYHPCSRDKTIGEKEGLAGYFNVMYLGNIGTAQALHVVLGAAKQLLVHHDIQFVFVGDGLEKKKLEDEARDNGLSNVKFLGKKSYESIANYMAWADLLFLHLKKDPTLEITIPSKTYSYLASGRPILGGCEGDVAELIEDNKAGIVIAPDDPAQLSKAVLDMFLLPSTIREEYGINARKAFENHYDRKVLIQEYEDLFLNCVNNKVRHK